MLSPEAQTLKSIGYWRVWSFGTGMSWQQRGTRVLSFVAAAFRGSCHVRCICRSFISMRRPVRFQSMGSRSLTFYWVTVKELTSSDGHTVKEFGTVVVKDKVPCLGCNLNFWDPLFWETTSLHDTIATFGGLE